MQGLTWKKIMSAGAALELISSLSGVQRGRGRHAKSSGGGDAGMNSDSEDLSRGGEGKRGREGKER